MQLLITPSGARIACDTAGSGDAIVFLHGWSLSRRVWQRQLEHFSLSRRVVALDLRGHGDSAPCTTWTLDDAAADIGSVFEQFDLRRAVLVGWSLGAQVAMAAVPLLRTRLSALVLVSATPKFTAAPDFPHGLPAAQPAGMALKLRRKYEPTLEGFFRGMFPGELPAAAESFLEGELAQGRRPDRESAFLALDTLAAGDLRPLAERLSLPTLLVHGDLDRICPPGASEWLHEHLPGSTRVVIDGTGHAPFLEKPEVFDRIIESFLEVNVRI